MRYLVLLLMLLALPAQAQLQFDSQPQALAPRTAESLTPGVMWLQRTPATLFDLGMMELTAAANKTAGALFDVTGAVAEYQADKGLIALTFFAKTQYSDENCDFVIKKLRDSMFPKRDDATQLANDLGSYFNNYGAAMPNRPQNVGAELVAILRFAVFMPGGACQLPLFGDASTTYWKDPNAPPPQLPAESTVAPANRQPLAPLASPPARTPAHR